MRAFRNRPGHLSDKKVMATFVKILVIVFLCEAAVMVILHVSGLRGLWNIVLDPFFLSVLSTPLLYRVIVKPVRDALEERKQAERNLYGYQERLRSLASEISKTEEQTRRKIAVELHDNIGHNLTITKMKTETLLEELANTEYSGSVNEIVDSIIKSIKDVSSFTFELSPAILYESGLDAAVEWLAGQFEEQSGITCCFNGDGQDKTLSNDLQVLLFRCIKELLTNIRKHAQAKMVSVTAGKDSTGYRITVEDDGIGFDLSSINSRKDGVGGFGLFSISERLKYQGGSIEIESQLQKGTRITLIVPIACLELNS